MNALNLVVLKKGQYISDVEPFKSTGIPTNVIIHKEVTGCGITTYAYKYFKKHTLSCLPNRPVIEDKVRRHNESCKASERILGVHKGIEIDDIVDYLSDETVTYKKILTTPEGFISKVLPAFEGQLEYLYANFFFLIDECERIITDVSYRGKIAAPIEHFFRFQEKAMVSATVMNFSDLRFESFGKLYIEPDYDYRKQIQLIETNNVIESLQRRLVELNSQRTLIFLNSTDTIFDTASGLDILEQSHAYCSQDSANKLFSKKFKNADDELKVEKLGKYNFFTSRFFSAFDITLEYKPDVIMITDVYSAPHSTLDPQTEVIQISGRCRNGVNSLTHITNLDSTLKSKTKDESLYYLQGCFDMYDIFTNLAKGVEHPGAKAMLTKAIEESFAHPFYTEGKISSFMVDNYIHEERVKSYYQNVVNLKDAYATRPKHFVVSHKSELYPLSDEDRRKVDSKKSAKEIRKELASQLYAVTPRAENWIPSSLDYQNYIRRLNPRLTKAFDTIGLVGLEETDYSYSQIDKAVAKKQRLNEIQLMAEFVFQQLDDMNDYSEFEVIRKLADIRGSLKLSKRTTATMIKLFFEARRTTKQGKPIWKLGNQRDVFASDYVI